MRMLSCISAYLYNYMYLYLEYQTLGNVHSNNAWI